MSKGSHQMKLKCCKISEWILELYLKWDGNLKRNRNMQALIGQMHKSIPSMTKPNSFSHASCEVSLSTDYYTNGQARIHTHIEVRENQLHVI